MPTRYALASAGWASRSSSSASAVATRTGWRGSTRSSSCGSGTRPTAPGSSLLMLGRRRRRRSGSTARRARWRESWEHATPTSWGRPIGAIKAALIAGRDEAAAGYAGWTLGLGTARPSRRSAATRRRSRCSCSGAGTTAPSSPRLSGRDDFPPAWPRRLPRSPPATLTGTNRRVEAVLASFETREDYLEDVAGRRHRARARPARAAPRPRAEPAGARRCCYRCSPAAAGRGRRRSVRLRSRRRLAGASSSIGPPKARVDRLGLVAPGDEDDDPPGGEQRRQRQRHAVDERLEPGRAARHEPLALGELGRAREERGHVAVGAEAEQEQVERDALELALVLRRRLGRRQLAADPVHVGQRARAGRAASAGRGR